MLVIRSGSQSVPKSFHTKLLTSCIQTESFVSFQTIHTSNFWSGVPSTCSGEDRGHKRLQVIVVQIRTTWFKKVHSCWMLYPTGNTRSVAAGVSAYLWPYGVCLHIYLSTTCSDLHQFKYKNTIWEVWVRSLMKAAAALRVTFKWK